MQRPEYLLILAVNPIFMKAIITLYCLLAGLLLKAQDSIPPVPPRDSGFTANRVPARYVLLYVEPLAALDGENGQSYRIGAEYAFSPKWGVYGTAGGYFEQGYILRAGIRRYTYTDEYGRGAWSLEYINNWHIHTIKDNYSKYDSSTRENAPDNSRPISFTTEKYINAISLIYSIQEFYGHHWVLEGYIGGGVKFKHVISSIPQTQEELLYHYHEDQAENFGVNPGTFIVPDVRMGLKIGFRIGRAL